MSRTINCPQCSKKTEFSSENKFRPFCSERCRLVDLGEWASESYKIAADKAQDEMDDYSTGMDISELSHTPQSH